MAKKTVLSTGKDVAAQIKRNDPNLHDAALGVARTVVSQFSDAIKTFSDKGDVGNAINSTAPGILKNSEMILPPVSPLSMGERASTNMDMFFALLDSSFTASLGDFQHRLVMSKLEEQVELLRSFTTIDWAVVAKGASLEDASGLFAKLQGKIYYSSQMHEVKKADLSQLVVLTRIPQFVQLLTLASGYGKLMLAANTSFNESRGFLKDNDDKNQEIISTLDGIVERFRVAEERRLRSIVEVEENTKLLQDALELAKVLAELDDRSAEMLSRVEIDKKLVAAMEEHTEQTVQAQLAELEELTKSMHLLSTNQLRKASVTSALVSLDLYIKCYVVFEMILTMLQVYLLAASSAVQTLLAQRIQTGATEFGKKFYMDNVKPLEAVITRYKNNFKPLELSAGLVDPEDREQVLAELDEIEKEVSAK